MPGLIKIYMATRQKYSEARDAIFGELYEIALKDPRVIVLSADTGAKKFKDFQETIPKQFYNIGISEQNAISAAAGLALTGKHVFVFGIANFVTVRPFEQIRIDVCGMNVPVTILAGGTGYVYSYDGLTHHMRENIALLRTLPNMTIWSPSDYTMTAGLVHLAYKKKGPSCIFFDKGPFSRIYDDLGQGFSSGIKVLASGKDITIIATGIMITQAFQLVEELRRHGLEAGLIDCYRLKPVNESLLLAALKGSKRIVTLEEHSLYGGLGSIIREVLGNSNLLLPIKSFGIGDEYRFEVGNRDYLWALDGLDVTSMTKAIRQWMKTI